MTDELGIDQSSPARPLQAAGISAASFASFAMVPIAAFSLLSLAVLGAFGGHLDGAALRVTPGGAVAMTVTAVIGRILGVSVG